MLQCPRILLTCFRERMSVHELGSMSLGKDPRKLDALKLVYVMVLALLPRKEPCGKLDLCFPSHNRNSDRAAANFSPDTGLLKRHVLGCVNCKWFTKPRTIISGHLNTGFPAYCDTDYCDKTLIVTVLSSKMISTTVWNYRKLRQSVIVTLLAGPNTVTSSQSQVTVLSHNNREAL